MTRVCTVCKSDQRDAIDRALIAGGAYINTPKALARALGSLKLTNVQIELVTFSDKTNELKVNIGRLMSDLFQSKITLTLYMHIELLYNNNILVLLTAFLFPE